MSSTSRWNAIPPEILQNIPASSACTACASHQLLGVCRSWRRAIRTRKQVPPPCRLKITGSIVSLEQAIKVCQMGCNPRNFVSPNSMPEELHLDTLLEAQALISTDQFCHSECQALHKLSYNKAERERLIRQRLSVMLHSMFLPNNQLAQDAKSESQKLLGWQTLGLQTDEQLQSREHLLRTLNPCLRLLGSNHNLTLPYLRGLRYLLDLLPLSFNPKLSEKLLDHFVGWRKILEHHNVDLTMASPLLRSIISTLRHSPPMPTSSIARLIREGNNIINELCTTDTGDYMCDASQCAESIKQALGEYCLRCSHIDACSSLRNKIRSWPLELLPSRGIAVTNNLRD